ncbi:MAG: hypothetical protein AAF773_27155 [Cyanobacteria bacterium P01_D01_bin.115]
MASGSEIEQLLQALKDWQKAVNQLTKKKMPLSAAEAQLAQAQQAVLAHLADEAIVDKLDKLIYKAIADCQLAEAVRETLIKDGASLITIELKTVHPLSVSQHELEQLIEQFLTTPDHDKPLTSSDEVQSAFQQLSEAIAQAYPATQPLSRKPKKRRRRDLAMGTLQTALGVGLLAGNTQMEPTVAGASYILGGNALLAALANLVGRLPTTQVSVD